MQRNWIGRRSGRRRRRHSGSSGARTEPVTIYTTRPDTLYGATFFVVAADSDLAAELAAGVAGRQPEFDGLPGAGRARDERDRPAVHRAATKTGVFLHRYAVNPVNGERLPIYAADYVLADYGHGAIMAVPAHDQRDLDFARAFDLPVRVVVDTGRAATRCRPGSARRPVTARLVNSGPLDGLRKADAIARIIEMLAGPGHRRGRRPTTGCGTG